VRPGLGVRPGFLLALALAGVALGSTIAGVLDAESFVGRLAASLGLGSSGGKVKRAAPRSLDGTGAVFENVPAVDTCRATYKSAAAPLGFSGDVDPTFVSSTLLNRLDEQEALRTCVEKLALPPATRWAGHYLRGVAAFNLALELDKLPFALSIIATDTKDAGGSAPFSPDNFARIATNAFDLARSGAPETHLAFIDRFVIDSDVLVQRSREKQQQPRTNPANGEVELPPQ